VGTTYDLSWYGGNFGAIVGSCPTYCGSNAIETFIGGVSIGTGSLLPSGADWFAQSLQFTAAAATEEVEFRLANTTASYLSIDGISLTEQGGVRVPEPASLTLLSLGLLGLGLVRRRMRSRRGGQGLLMPAHTYVGWRR
jgi:hypothetical protein